MRSTEHNILGKCIIFLSIFRLVLCQQEGPGRPIALFQANVPAPLQCTASDNGPKCADCNTMLTCAGSFLINSQPCGTLNSQTPYCDLNTNTCVNQLAAESDTCQANDFLCTASGTFPDPTNCRLYYICGGQNEAALSAYECPPYLVYDSKDGLCKRSLICQNIDCSRNANKFVVYNANPAYMVYCLQTNFQQSHYVFRCPDAVNMEYDRNTLQCSFKCRKEGRVADLELCTRYYECYLAVGGYKYIRQTCPPGFGFDPNKLVCVQQSTCVNQVSGDEISTSTIV